MLCQEPLHGTRGRGSWLVEISCASIPIDWGWGAAYSGDRRVYRPAKNAYTGTTRLGLLRRLCVPARTKANCVTVASKQSRMPTESRIHWHLGTRGTRGSITRTMVFR